MVVRTDNRFFRILSLWGPVAACMAAIFYASSLPAEDIPSLFPNEDILFHAGIYAILALFFYRALKNSVMRLARPQLLVLSVIFGLAYGATDEFHQFFVPGRCSSGFDLAVDAAGSFLGSFLGGFLVKWLK